jgi:hypothetical protein
LVADLPSFMQNLMQTCCFKLRRPSRTKWNTKSKEHLGKNNVCSQPGFTWQTDAIGLWKCDLGLPSHLLSPR